MIGTEKLFIEGKLEWVRKRGERNENAEEAEFLREWVFFERAGRRC